jgi:hypothetical protein
MNKITLVGTKVEKSDEGERYSSVKIDFDPRKEYIFDALRERIIENVSHEEAMDFIRTWKWALKIEQEYSPPIIIPVEYFKAMNTLAGYL